MGPGVDGDVSDLDRVIEDSWTVSDASWQARAETGRALGDPQARPFIRHVSRRMAERGMLDMSVLYLDSRPLSFIWGAARWPVTTISKLAFVEDMKPDRPGIAHMWLVIEDSIARGLSHIDYGHEFPEHKQRWSKRAVPLYEIRCFLPTLPSRLLRAYEHRPDWLDAAGKKLLGRFVSSGASR